MALGCLVLNKLRIENLSLLFFPPSHHPIINRLVIHPEIVFKNDKDKFDTYH